LNPAPSLTFSKLGCTKGGRQLFRDIDCEVSAGQWLYVTGANGVGKTSLLRMVCGLASVEAGQILWNGTPIQQQADIYRQDLCYLGHLNALQESMTVDENLRFTSALGGLAPEREQRLQVLAHFGLRGRSQQLVRHLSQGQKRRVALSRLVLSPARLWVLDEPYVAMDESGINLLADLIGDHIEAGGLVVLTSHQKVPIRNLPAKLLELKAV
jgi:heme exporter protein A